jgi:hypothetical protein
MRAGLPAFSKPVLQYVFDIHVISRQAENVVGADLQNVQMRRHVEASKQLAARREDAPLGLHSALMGRFPEPEVALRVNDDGWSIGGVGRRYSAPGPESGRCTQQPPREAGVATRKAELFSIGTLTSSTIRTRTERRRRPAKS